MWSISSMANDSATVKRCVRILLNEFDHAKRELDARVLKELKTAVRTNESMIPELVELLKTNLCRNNSDLRMAVVKLSDYFFQRSHMFRMGLLGMFRDFTLRTLELDPIHFPLPRPLAAASALKKFALETIRLWIDKFASSYPQLRSAERYLSSSKQFDFNNVNAESLVERNRMAQQRFQQEVLARKTLEKCHLLYQEHHSEMQNSLAECRNLLELIFPKFCDKPARDDHIREGPSAEELKRLHGYERDRVVNVVVPADGRIEIPHNEDTADLFNTLRDCRVQLESHLQRIDKWLKKVSRVASVEMPSSSGSSSMPSPATLVRRLIDLRDDLRMEIGRCNQLKTDKEDTGKDQMFVPKTLTRKIDANADDSGVNDDGDKSDDNDDDFVDEELKEGLELDFDSSSHKNIEDPIPRHILEKIRQNEAIDANRPGPSGLQNTSSSSSSSNSKRDSGVSLGSTDSSKQMAFTIPKLPFGLDLRYWGQSVEPAEHVRNQFDGHRFWRAPDTEASIKESAESYSSRMMTFIGEMPAISRMCRAPLTNGKLCPRMDRHRCPIHGEIIPRDATGQPTGKLPSTNDSQGDGKSSKSTQNLNEVLGGEEYLRDLEDATGVDLAPKNKRPRNAPKKRKVPQNVELRHRLTAKLLDKRTVRRVTQVMDEMQKARAERQFAHQFNYALNNHRK